MDMSSFPTTITNTTNTVTTASAAASSQQYQHHHQQGQQQQQPSTSASTSTSRLLGNPSASGGGSQHSQPVTGLSASGYGHHAHGSASGSNIYSYPISNPSGAPGNTSNLLQPPSASGAADTTTTTSGAAAAGNDAAGGGSTSFYNHHYQQPSGHSFLSDVNEVKDMENSLLTLLASFHAGDLSAFGKGCSLQTMETIRAKQERLAKLHFELGSSKAGNTGTTDSATQNWMSDDDQNKLVAELRELSLEIEKLHETSS